MVNGRTGEVQGEYPVSVFKIIMVILLVIAIILLIVQLKNS
jgi:amino acid permease